MNRAKGADIVEAVATYSLTVSVVGMIFWLLSGAIEKLSGWDWRADTGNAIQDVVDFIVSSGPASGSAFAVTLIALVVAIISTSALLVLYKVGNDE